MNVLTEEKHELVLLVPVFYLMAVMSLAPIFKMASLIFFLVFGSVTYYAAAHLYLDDAEFVNHAFPHMTAIVFYTCGCINY